VCGVFSLTNDDVVDDGGTVVVDSSVRERESRRHMEEEKSKSVFMEKREGGGGGRNVKEDKFLVKFKRLLINGEQYITNVEKFGNQECWKFEGEKEQEKL
jgi:hypothetical protein